MQQFKAAGLIDRVMFGSDQMCYPGMISKAIALTKAAGLTDNELTKVFWSNAARILGISQDGSTGEWSKKGGSSLFSSRRCPFEE